MSAEEGGTGPLITARSGLSTAVCISPQIHVYVSRHVKAWSISWDRIANSSQQVKEEWAPTVHQGAAATQGGPPRMPSAALPQAWEALRGHKNSNVWPLEEDTLWCPQ